MGENHLWRTARGVPFISDWQLRLSFGVFIGEIATSDWYDCLIAIECCRDGQFQRNAETEIKGAIMTINIVCVNLCVI